MAWIGQIFFGDTDGQNDAAGVYSSFAGSPPWTYTNIYGSRQGFLYGTVDGNTGWMPSDNFALPVPMPKFFISDIKQASIAINLANQFNTLPVLMPMHICITRDSTGAWIETSNFSIEGFLPDVYMCNLRNLVPASQIDDGSGALYRAYPFYNKADSGIESGGSTGWFGFAVKEN
jgi:hypothetical protein